MQAETVSSRTPLTARHVCHVRSTGVPREVRNASRLPVSAPRWDKETCLIRVHAPRTRPTYGTAGVVFGQGGERQGQVEATWGQLRTSTSAEMWLFPPLIGWTEASRLPLPGRSLVASLASRSESIFVCCIITKLLTAGTRAVGCTSVIPAVLAQRSFPKLVNEVTACKPTIVCPIRHAA